MSSVNPLLKTCISEESYPVLYTDRERLFQILSIYLDNAVYYSPENSTIEIRTKQTSKELTFYVVDHGCGVAEEDKPFIFNRFYCADKSRTDKSHFGLGLSIAKELSRILGGKIGFEDTAWWRGHILFDYTSEIMKQNSQRLIICINKRDINWSRPLWTALYYH